MSSTPVIHVEGFGKSFGGAFGRSRLEAARDINLRVERGQVVALVGPNGAGKTTTIFAILGLVKPDKGRIQLFGEPAGSRSAQMRTGFQPEIFFTYGFKSAAEVLRFYGNLSLVDAGKLDAMISRQLSRLGLHDARDRKTRGFSKGMIQRLGLAQALLHDPDLLILDEPASGLDPEGRKLVTDLILEEKSRGKTILLSSHILSDLEKICDHVVMIQKGLVVFSERMESLRSGASGWEVEVTTWTPAAREAVGRTEILAGESGVSWILCSESEKSELMSRLLAAGAEIGAIRAQQSLEEIYMRHANTPHES